MAQGTYEIKGLAVQPSEGLTLNGQVLIGAGESGESFGKRGSPERTGMKEAGGVPQRQVWAQDDKAAGRGN